MKFNKDTRIGEILEVAPEKAEILLNVGMHCIGCPASQMETIEEACDVHGIDVEDVLEKLNAEQWEKHVFMKSKDTCKIDYKHEKFVEYF